MTIATRLIDGHLVPAHIGAPKRLRQSHFDALRKINARIAEMKAEEAELASAAGETPEMGTIKGTVWAAITFASMLAWFALFAGFGLI